MEGITSPDAVWMPSLIGKGPEVVRELIILNEDVYRLSNGLGFPLSWLDLD